MAERDGGRRMSAVAALIMSEPDRDLGGRPTLYRPEYCEQVVEFCSGGLSLTAFAGDVGVSRRTISYWRASHPDFDDACEAAKASACLWYERQAQHVAKGSGGPGAATLVMFALKNLGAEDFSDRRQVQHVGQVSHRHLTYEQAVEEAHRRGLPVHVLEEGGTYLSDLSDEDECDADAGG